MERKKTVLFISLSFFAYEKTIINSIEKLGLEVDFYDERASNNSFFKAILRINKKIVRKRIDDYYNNILDEIKYKKYDYFLLIKGEAIPEFFIKKFIQNNPKSELIFYTFDSIKNNPNCLFILKYFHKCYSFDFEDVKKYPFLKLKHLFYAHEFENNYKVGLDSRIYDISFIGTLHSNRYKIINYLASSFQKKYIFYYVPAKWMYFLKKLLDRDFKKVKYTEISFKKIDRKEVALIFSQSKCVIDIQRYNQTGLTMRTFEVLAAGAILITSNKYIKEFEYYEPNSVVIIENEDNLKEALSEIKKKTSLFHENKVSHEFLKKYHVDNWVKEFFNVN